MTNYLDAMDTVSSLMDDALTDIETAYTNGGTLTVPKIDINGNYVYVDGKLDYRDQTARGYLNTYERYMDVGESHTGWTRDSDDAENHTFFDEVQDNSGKVTVGLDSQQQSHSFHLQSTYMHILCLFNPNLC